MIGEEFEVECASCGIEFHIVFDDDEAEPRYCPYCGNEIIEELNFE
jgi:predicted RNA-binding Zn-ribbon protein involved in translation (DUF1610 family)